MIPSRSRVLVVDDEPQIHRFLGPALSAAGYEPLRAETAAAALGFAGRREPSLVLLDLGLPDLDGQAVISLLRAVSDVPIIVVSARGQDEAKVAALDAGADDYVEKPFAVAELLARIRAALRRAGVTASEEGAGVLRAGPLEMDAGRRLARVEGGEPLKLTPREWDLLAALAGARGRVLTHRQLLTAVWGPAHVEDGQYLRVYVGHLRQKLGTAASLLRNEPGVGYRFGED